MSPIAGAPVPTQQETHAGARDGREGGGGVDVERESEQRGVEANGSGDVVDHAAGVSFRTHEIVKGPGGRQVILDDRSGNPIDGCSFLIPRIVRSSIGLHVLHGIRGLPKCQL
jgi:hypothetical protein